MRRVAVIGLGAMGAPIAGRLLAAGREVAVWNRSPERAAELRRDGAVVAGSPADAARAAEAVIVMVTGPQALREVTEGAAGIAAGAGPGSVLIQMSTVPPSSIARLASVLPAGACLLDAPVLGSVAEAAAGALRILVGGAPDLAGRCEPVLRRLGTPLRVGALGAGSAAKLVANNALFGVLGVLGEALALGQALGLSWGTVHDVLSMTPLAEQAARRRGAIEDGEFPPRFPLALASKDAGLVAELARDYGLGLHVTGAAADWLAGAERAGLAGRDYTAVLAHIMRAAAGEPEP